MKKGRMKMSIGAKQVMLKNLEQKFGHTLTVDDMNDVLKIIADELDAYSLEQAEDYEFDLSSKDMLDAFLSAKELEGRSPKTLERYRYILSRLFNYCKMPIKSITIYHLRKYLMTLKETGCKDTTLEGIREVFSSFFNWLQKEKLIDTNPCANLAPIKCMKVQRLPFSHTDIEKLKEACTSVRDKAIICFLLSTGCRISEVTQLNRVDIDFEKHQCKVLGKGNKERMVYIDEVTAWTLNRYFDNRQDTLPALFIGRGSPRMTPQGIRKMLNMLGDKAHVDYVHPHRFRRTLATNLIHRGMPIQEVAKILGHDKLDTTMKYVYIDNNSLHFSYKKFNA